jgi:hypothetical protein
VVKIGRFRNNIALLDDEGNYTGLLARGGKHKQIATQSSWTCSGRPECSRRSVVITNAVGNRMGQPAFTK